MEVNFLKSIQTLLQFVIDNWTSIIIIFGLALSLATKIRDYVKLSKEEKINIAKQQIEEIMLKLVTDAEEDYLEWVNAGSIKRSQVIEQIFTMYPALSKVANQEELIVWLDGAIDDALKIMRDIFEKQLAEEKEIITTTISNEETDTTIEYVAE